LTARNSQNARTDSQFTKAAPMNFKRWRLGLLVACLAGLFGAVTTLGIATDIGGWKQFCLILAIGMAKDGLLFLARHPVDTISTDTDLLRKAMASKKADGTLDAP
jgi:hypothetical protein